MVMKCGSCLDASSHLYKRPCPSVFPLIGPSVGWSVRNTFVNFDERSMFTDVNRGGDEEGGAMMRERGDSEQGRIHGMSRS